MRTRTRLLLVLPAAVVLVAATVVPADASRPGPSGFPQFPSYPFETRLGSGGPAPFVQDPTDPAKWVWTLDPMTTGATGTITFYGYRNAITHEGVMSGPGGVGPNDWQVCVGKAHCRPGKPAFDFSRPSFTQDVDSVPADFLTPDPPSTISSDWDPTLYHPDGISPPRFFGDYPDANMDGSANLFKFAYTIAPGTQFMNMQIDKAGNYYVARRDMQWQWIDSFTYKHGSDPMRVVDTQFNIQPYPISDAFGWCGALPPVDPNSREPMAGQLTKDIAFDVFAGDTTPGSGIKPISTEVVPSFQMRSYGKYVVDVTMLATGVHQHFEGTAKSVHVRPVDVTIGDTTYPAGSTVQPGDPDYSHWFNRVSPFAAGVVPVGAWVINEGTQYLQVVPAGTPGAVWHQNKFAGAAFLVRGDMERRVNYVLAASSDLPADQMTTVGDRQVYRELIESGAVNRATGQPWKRSDWTDWQLGGLELLPDAY